MRKNHPASAGAETGAGTELQRAGACDFATMLRSASATKVSLQPQHFLPASMLLQEGVLNPSYWSTEALSLLTFLGVLRRRAALGFPLVENLTDEGCQGGRNDA